MKILFDQGTPVPLRKILPDHSITTTYELGWQTLENGNLITEAEADGFDVIQVAVSVVCSLRCDSIPLISLVVSLTAMPFDVR